MEFGFELVRAGASFFPVWVALLKLVSGSIANEHLFTSVLTPDPDFTVGWVPVLGNMAWSEVIAMGYMR
jgi:hypothetical protein